MATINQVHIRHFKWFHDHLDHRTTLDMNCKKLIQEACELQDNPKDVMEQADVLISLMSVMIKSNTSLNCLLEAVDMKLEKLEKRNWEIGKDGVLQHVPTTHDP